MQEPVWQRLDDILKVSDFDILVLIIFRPVNKCLLYVLSLLGVLFSCPECEND